MQHASMRLHTKVPSQLVVVPDNVCTEERQSKQSSRKGKKKIRRDLRHHRSTLKPKQKRLHPSPALRRVRESATASSWLVAMNGPYREL